MPPKSSINFWRHTAYRFPDAKSFLICGTPHTTERVKGTLVSLFTENAIVAIRAEVQNAGGKRWTRSFWVARLATKGRRTIFSVDQPVNILFSIAGSQLNIKRATRILKEVLKMPNVSINNIDYSLFADALQLNLPDNEIVKMIPKANKR